MAEVVDLESTVRTQITDMKSETTRGLLKKSIVCMSQYFETSLQRTIGLTSIVEPVEEN